MRRLLPSRFLLAVLAAFLCSPLLAGAPAGESGSPDVGEDALDAVDVEDYLAQRREIMLQVNAGDLGRLSRARRNELEDSWSTLRRLLDGKRSIADLSTPQRIEFFNAQSTFTAIIERQRENGLICRDDAPTGSRIPQVVCERVRDREARRGRAREAVDRLQAPTCVQVNGVGNC
ncbi:hypothetical protein [Silanimonas sp.]|jgi:hypothetical protein|uniref:hypothetical protein n=1 Tax=Silanimonas sp. TaxID=1929290 RepID=UPI0022C7CD83|nr:hypothetical protein [Silanimonas sp.]MCZ8061571.1 hypothetical protein [Silanimonas sp.]